MKLELKQTVALVLCLILIFSITACTSEISTPEEPEVAEETEETVEDSKYTSGSYSASSNGFGGDVTVVIEVDADKIISVKATGEHETSGIGSLAVDKLPDEILKAQSAEIDGVTGATMSSNAIKSAAADAIAKASGTSLSAEVKMKPGSYTASAWGFNPIGQMTITVTVDETSIKNIEITDRGPDDLPMVQTVIDLMIPRILESQSLSVDAITGATASSNAVKVAATEAITEALLAGGSNTTAIKNFENAIEKKTIEETIDVDVLVVGMGGSGCSAATSVAEHMYANDPNNVSVLAIDKAGKFGGTSSVCGEPMGINAPKYKAEFNNGEDYMDKSALREAWLEYTEGDAKTELVDIMLDNSGDTIDWLYYDHGFLLNNPLAGFTATDVYKVKYQYVYNGNVEEGRDYGVDEIKPVHEMVDDYFKTMISNYEKLGGKYMLETEAYELLYDEASNEIKGVKARKYDGTEYTINAKAVILATGGFAGNGEMEEKYLSNEYDPLKGAWNLIGMTQNDGKMIQSAIDLGAGTYNIDMSPMVHFAVTPQIIRGVYPVNQRDGISWWYGWQNTWSLNDVPISMVLSKEVPWINAEGNRFVNETKMFSWWMAGPSYFSIWSQNRVDDVKENGFPALYSTNAQGQGGVPANMPIPEIYDIIDIAMEAGYIHKADTLEELAEIIGVSAENLVKTVENYDAACKAGVDEEFGKPAEQLVAIGEGPYYAVEGRSACFSTCGALDIDTNFNVLKEDGNTPINGLYAVGNDSMGVLYSNKKPYVTYGGAALGWAYTSGRLVGESCTNYVSGK